MCSKEFPASNWWILLTELLLIISYWSDFQKKWSINNNWCTIVVNSARILSIKYKIPDIFNKLSFPSFKCCSQKDNNKIYNQFIHLHKWNFLKLTLLLTPITHEVLHLRNLSYHKTYGSNYGVNGSSLCRPTSFLKFIYISTKHNRVACKTETGPQNFLVPQRNLADIKLCKIYVDIQSVHNSYTQALPKALKTHNN